MLVSHIPCELSWGVFEQGSLCRAMTFLVQRREGSWGVLGLFWVSKVSWGFPRQNRPDRFSLPFERLSPTEAVWPVSETGLTGFWLPAVESYWLLVVSAPRSSSTPVGYVDFGKRSLRRRTSEIGFIAEFLNRIFIVSHSLPLWLVRCFGHSCLH
jgi:hypothetical protein